MPSPDPITLERSIQRIGREIYTCAEDAAPSLLSEEYWQQSAMTWITADEELKSRLFRFIEALPSLHTPQAVAAKLREELRPENGSARRLTPLFAALTGYRRSDSIYAHAVAELARRGSLHVARRFIAGASPAEAIRTVARLRRGGMTYTLDLLGEAVRNDAVARGHLARYLEMIHELSAAVERWPTDEILDLAPWGWLSRVNVSIKLSALAPGLDRMPAEQALPLLMERVRPILQAARRRGGFVNIDLEQHALKNLTLRLFQRILTEEEFKEWSACGVVIQAYLKDSEKDLRELIAWARRRGAPVTVRLVKGAYWDSEVAWARQEGRPPPVFTEKWHSDQNFERLTSILMEHAEVVRPAIASHNIRSIAAALALESAHGLPARTVEFQMLTGMGDPLKRALTAMRQRLRVYCPFGDWIPGMAYLIRRLIENTSNESTLLQTFGRQVAVDDLLRKPGE